MQRAIYENFQARGEGGDFSETTSWDHIVGMKFVKMSKEFVVTLFHLFFFIYINEGPIVLVLMRVNDKQLS